MSYIFTKGATSQSIELYIVDSTDGTPETGVLWNTAGIDLKYRRKDAVVVSITEAALTTPLLTDTWETGGFLEIGNGVYRLDLPDAALASAAGIDRVVVFGTVTGMVVLPVTIHLTAFDLSTASAAQTADNETRLTTIETDTNEIQGKLPTNKFMGSSDGADDDGNIAAILTDTAEIGAAGVGLTEAGGDGDQLTAINLPNQTMDITGNLSGSVGSLTGHTNQTGDNFARLGAPAGASVSADIAADKAVDDAIKVVTDLLADAATTFISGTVSWDNTNATTTVFYSDDITEATADHYKGREVIFLSGALFKQATDITAYALDTGEGKFTVTALTEPPADNVTFVIV